MKISFLKEAFNVLSGNGRWVNCIFCHRGFVCYDENLRKFVGKKGYVVCKYCGSKQNKKGRW